MSLNLLVTAVVLVCFNVMLARGQRHPDRPLSRVAPALMLVAESPLLLYPPYVPLSHIFFEVTTPAVQVTTIVVVGLLWVSAAVQLRRFAALKPHPAQVRAAIVLLGCAAFWTVLGATISEFESGPTPTVWDRPVWLAHLATLYVAAACQVTLIVGRRSRRRVNPG